jgi:transaldolase
MNTLDSLKKHSQIVADTADFQILEQFNSIDTTTNPTLIQQACQPTKSNAMG